MFKVASIVSVVLLRNSLRSVIMLLLIEFLRPITCRVEVCEASLQWLLVLVLERLHPPFVDVDWTRLLAFFRLIATVCSAFIGR